MLKRAFDFTVSLAVVLMALPLWLIVAIAIKLDSPGPVVHRAARIGKGGQPFTIYKFRTMVADAACRGPRITRPDDPRITRVGRFLRKLRVDEMPQLINVLKGEMSLVGPRPEDAYYVAQYTPEQRRVFSVRPGMANPNFTTYRDEVILANTDGDLDDTYLTAILPNKLRLDLEYIEHQSFLLDLVLFLRVAFSLFTTADRSQPEAEVQSGRIEMKGW